MLYLECEVKNPAALGDLDVIAVVKDASGRIEQVQVEKGFVVQRSGRTFLPVWAINQDQTTHKVQIELPVEAASGTNRLWVHATQVFLEQEKKEVPT